MYYWQVTTLFYLSLLGIAVSITLPPISQCGLGFAQNPTTETHSREFRDHCHAVLPISITIKDPTVATRLWDVLSKPFSLVVDSWELPLFQKSKRAIQRPRVDYKPISRSRFSTSPDTSDMEDNSANSLAIKAEPDIDKRAEALPEYQTTILTNGNQPTNAVTTLPMATFQPETPLLETEITSTGDKGATSGAFSIVDLPPSSTSSYQPVITASQPANLSTNTPLPSLPSSDDCSQCFIIFKFVSVYYPPAQSSSTDCLKGVETPSASLPPGLEPLPGSAYVVIPELSAGNACTKIAEFTSLTFTFGPGELSTIQGPANITKEFNFADLPCPPPDVASDVKWLYNPEVNPTRTYMPVVAPFSQLYELQPGLQDCNVGLNQGFDPSIAIPTANGPTLPRHDKEKMGLGSFHPRRHPVGAHQVPRFPTRTGQPLLH